MQLTHKNYLIIWEDDNATAYSTKSKNKKLLGYYANVKQVLKGLYKQSKGKKGDKPGDKELLALYRRLEKQDQILARLSNIVYQPIDKLNKEINGY